MMTRIAGAQKTAEILEQTLQELKESKETCNLLLRERDESEEKNKTIIVKNSNLKSELLNCIHIARRWFFEMIKFKVLSVNLSSN